MTPELVCEIKYYFERSDFSEIACDRFEYFRTATVREMQYSTEEYLLFCFLSGRGRIEVGGGTALSFRPGELALGYPYLMLRLRAEPHSELLIIGFSGDKMRRICGYSREPTLLRSRPSFGIAAQELLNAYREKREGLDYLCLSLVFGAISGLGKPFLEKEPDIIELFIRFVEENCASALRVESVCKQLGVSVTYFTHRFTKEMNISPRQYLIGVRMNKAKSMLRHTSCTIEEIARNVGYEYATHFCKEFKRSFGFTPMAYRNSINF